MKFIITILLLTIGVFAKNTTFIDGTDCECDSIYSEYYETGVIMGELAVGGSKWHHKSYYNSGALYEEVMMNPYIYAMYDPNGNIYIIGDKYERITFYHTGGYDDIIYVDDDSKVYSYKIKTKTNIHYVTFDSHGRIEKYIPSNGDAYWFGYHKPDHRNLTDGNGKLTKAPIVWDKNYKSNYQIIGTATYKNGQLIGYKKCTDGRLGNENLDCLN